MKRILVVSPHPDDEAIGCGGTICNHVAAGDSVRVIFLTSGEMGGHGRSPEDTAALREQEAQKAARILGYDSFEFWRCRDGSLQATGQVTDRLRTVVTDWNPHVLYVPHGLEMHDDHRAASRIVRDTFAALDDNLTHCQVLEYEVWTPLQTLDVIVDISPYVALKRAAIRAYESQCEVLAFDDAVLGLNRYRGEMHSWPGGDYAEVFAEREP